MGTKSFILASCYTSWILVLLSPMSKKSEQLVRKNKITDLLVNSNTIDRLRKKQVVRLIHVLGWTP